MAPALRIRPYKDFLTPALHRRFAMGTASVLLLCYVEAIWIGSWDSFLWTWFPLGRTGIRTALIFIPAFMIFILRVAQLHVGLRTSPSAWHTFRTYAFGSQVVQTLGWYFLSAWLFSEVYVWSVEKDADLNRIRSVGRERPTLNEKPIYLLSFHYFIAIIQAIWHLVFDYDRINMPVPKPTHIADSQKDKQSAVPVAQLSPTTQLQARIPKLALNSLSRAVILAVVFPFIYVANFGIYPYSVRHFAWSFTRSFAKIAWHLPKSGALPAVYPFHWIVLWKSFMTGFLLTFLWEVGNAAFSIYVAQEPLKNDRPITYESRDPNGSLLTGLRGKKLQTRAFAFWELVYIALRFEGRRKMIFEDIDRKGGSAWSQIRDVCLEVINGMSERITAYQTPPTVATSNLAVRRPEDIPSLPRITKPLGTPDNIFSTPTKPQARGERAVEAIGSFAKRHGQSPPTGLSPASRALLGKVETALLTTEQRQALATRGIGGMFGEWTTWFLKSNVGWVFRQEYRRRMAYIVLGAPYGDVGVIVDAITALTRLAVCSLKEDPYGNVHRDVKLIILTLTATVTKLETFKRDLGIHWTDVDGKQESPEIEMIMTALKKGLKDLLEGFAKYFPELGMSDGDLRRARGAAEPLPAAREREMKEKR